MQRKQTPRLRKASNLPYSVAATKQEVTLYSGDAQSLLRHYNFTSAAIYKIGINLRKLGVPEERVQETEKLVYEEILKPLQDDLTKEIARLQQQFGNPQVAEFTQPFTGTAEIQYPRAKLLLKLLVDFDQLIFLVEQLWHAELIGDSEYLKLTEGFRDRLKESEKRIASIAREAIQLAQKQKEDADVEDGIASMATAAASSEASESGTKGPPRKGRKTAEPDKSKEERDASPVIEATEGEKGETFSPFAMQ